jgi:hypothetical protein
MFGWMCSLSASRARVKTSRAAKSSSAMKTSSRVQKKSRNGRSDLDLSIDDARERQELTAIGCVFLSIDRSTPAIFTDSAECGGAVPLGRRSCPAERREAGASDFLPLVLCTIRIREGIEPHRAADAACPRRRSDRMRRLAIDDTGYYLPALSFITC